jgi:hypothetical protein
VIGEPWSKVLEETAANYWAKHLNAASVSVAALVHGLDADFMKEARKPELVLRLVNEEHEPLSLDEIRAAFSPASSDLQDEPEQDGTAGAPRRDGESEARAPEKSPAVFNFSEGQLTRLLESLTVRTAVANDGPGKAQAPKPVEVPYDAHLRKCTKTISENLYLDPTQLSRTFLDHIKDKQPGHGAQREVVIDNGQLVLTAGAATRLKDVSKLYDVAQIMSGLNRMFEIMACSSSQAVRELLPDRLKWNRLVWDSRLGSAEAKPRFIKEFMFKHQGRSDWASLFETDFALIHEFLAIAPPNNDGRRNKRGRSAHGGEDRDHAVGPNRGQPRKRRREARTCFSRLQIEAGACKYDDCRFDHKCASCGQDHAAVDCPTWDASKVAAKKLGPRRRQQ